MKLPSTALNPGEKINFSKENSYEQNFCFSHREKSQSHTSKSSRKPEDKLDDTSFTTKEEPKNIKHYH